MRRSIFTLLLVWLAGCGDGSRGGPIAAPIVQPQEDGVDRGDGTDHGGEATTSANTMFAKCQQTSDCGRGDCIDHRCIVFCAAPPRGELAVRVELCLRGEQCFVLSNGAGLCLQVCSNDTECPNGSTCNRFDPSLPGNFCVPAPRSSTSTTEPPPELD